MSARSWAIQSNASGRVRPVPSRASTVVLRCRWRRAWWPGSGRTTEPSESPTTSTRSGSVAVGTRKVFGATTDGLGRGDDGGGRRRGDPGGGLVAAEQVVEHVVDAVEAQRGGDPGDGVQHVERDGAPGAERSLAPPSGRGRGVDEGPQPEADGHDGEHLREPSMRSCGRARTPSGGGRARSPPAAGAVRRASHQSGGGSSTSNVGGRGLSCGERRGRDRSGSM